MVVRDGNIWDIREKTMQGYINTGITKSAELDTSEEAHTACFKKIKEFIDTNYPNRRPQDILFKCVMSGGQPLLEVWIKMSETD